MTENTDLTRKALESIAKQFECQCPDKFAPDYEYTYRDCPFHQHFPMFVNAVIDSGLLITTTEVNQREMVAWKLGNNDGFTYGFKKGYEDPDFDNENDDESPKNPFVHSATESDTDRG